MVSSLTKHHHNVEVSPDYVKKSNCTAFAVPAESSLLALAVDNLLSRSSDFFINIKDSRISCFWR